MRSASGMSPSYRMPPTWSARQRSPPRPASRWSSASRCTPSSWCGPSCSAAARRPTARRRTPTSVRSASDCPAPCRCSTRPRSRRACGWRSPPTAPCTRRRSSPARTTSIPTCRRGYQISQFDRPFATGGRVEYEVAGRPLVVRLRRIHLEEDAGKSIHDGFPDSSLNTYLDFNRSGVPLCEIVTEPDLRSPEEAYAYLTRLKSILTFTGVCDGNMEEGSLRCDANVSLRPAGRAELGIRAELKNLNSFRNVQRALEYEMTRQEGILREGGTVAQEDPPVRRPAWHHRVDALQGGEPRLPVLSGAGPPPPGHPHGAGGGNPGDAAGAAGGAQAPFHGGVRPARAGGGAAHPRAGRSPTISRRWRAPGATRARRRTGSWGI